MDFFERETLQNNEKYADYLRCGEIYKSPSQSDRTPYILKCFRCTDVFLLLESFIFHIEDYCKQEEASTSTAVATIKSEEADEGQQFNIELVEGNYSGHDAKDDNNGHEMEEDVLCIEEDVDCELTEASSTEIRNVSTVCIENEEDCELIEDSLVEIRNEPIADNDDICVDAVDIYVSDVFLDEDNDVQNEGEHSGDEDLEPFGFQELGEDTESADEDPNAHKAHDPIANDDSSLSPFVLRFMESRTNVLSFINSYKYQPKLWNKKMYPYYEDQYQRCLDSFTKVLNSQLKLAMPSNIVSEIILYLERTYREDLECLRKTSPDGKKYKPSWFFEYLRFLKPYVSSNLIANLDKSLPPMTPGQIIEVINIYKTFPHLWDSSLAEYCCSNKRFESEVLMLRTIHFRLRLELTQPMLQKYIRCIHSYFGREKYKHLENTTKSPDAPAADGEPDYYSHLQFLYDHVGPFKCPDCDHILKSSFLMKTHMSKHNRTTPLTCSLCKKGFKTIAPYISHARRHMEDFDEECKMCGEKFLTQAELESHKLSHSNAFICDICDASFTSNVALINHKNTHKKRVLYRCRICSKVFSNKQTLENHLMLHRSDISNKCKTCGKVLPNAKALRAHETLHSSFKKFDCSKCGKVFKSKFNVDMHMRSHEL